MRIDKGMAKTFVLRHIFAKYIKVDNNNPYCASHLWSCKSDTFAGIEGLIHILQKLLQTFIVGRNILCNLS